PPGPGRREPARGPVHACRPRRRAGRRGDGAGTVPPDSAESSVGEPPTDREEVLPRAGFPVPHRDPWGGVMKPEDVKAEWVEKAARAIAEFNACGHCDGSCAACTGEARHALAAVIPDIQAQALVAARDMLVAASDRGLAAGHGAYSRATRDAAGAVGSMIFDARLTGCPRCCPEPCCDHRNAEYGNCTDCY